MTIDMRALSIGGLFALALSFALVPPPVLADDEDRPEDFPVIQLQSKLMSFADQFIAELSEARNTYVFQGEEKSAVRRMIANQGRLNASASVVSIAAGRNPEVALLDMLVLVHLLAYTVEDVWMPQVLGPEAQVFLDAFASLEKRLWEIGDGILSEAQIQELNELVRAWREDHKEQFAVVANVRFSEFSEYRHDSTLFEDGEPGGLFKTVDKVTREVERTRLLAERAIFLAERQPKLVAWQVEQVFYNLAITKELATLVDGMQHLPAAAQAMADNVEELSQMLNQMLALTDPWSVASAHQLADGLSVVSSRVIRNTGNEFGLELLVLGVFLLLGLLAVLLCYKFLALKMEAAFRREADKHSP